MAKTKTPVTIVTGYLGAGKTTLLRRMASETDMKLAILMNEFGDVAIDSKVVEGKNIKMAELAGGCVCCSLSGEFEAALKEIIETVKPEWIVVETTGVAEPAALADDIVKGIDEVRLDAIVTLVDCDALTRFPNLGHTGAEQIEMADIVLLNKIDLVNEKNLLLVKDKIRMINQRAILLETRRAEADLEAIFGVGGSKGGASAGPKKRHKNEFEYFDYTDEKIDHDKLLEILDNLPKQIYRTKGFVVTQNGSFLVNFVAGRYDFEHFESKKTSLVFIGKGIAKEKETIIKKLQSASLSI